MKTNDGTSKNQLKRELTLFPLTNIIIANMIGAGIFTTSGLLMADLQNPLLMLLLWVVGGIIAICGALNYGELGAAIPEAGGEYAFLAKLFHPLLGFLSGWVSLIVGFSAAIAASAIGFSEYLYSAFPDLAGSTLMPDLWAKRLISVGVIGLFAVIHMFGINFGSKIQNWLTLLKVALICGLILIGFTIGEGSWDNIVQSTQSTFEFSDLKTVGLSLMWIMFAYSGWNAAVYIGSEIKDPKRNLPLSLIIGTGIVILLYFFLNLFFVYAVEPEKMQGVISIGGLAVEQSLGETEGTIISLLIAFALFSSLSAYLILGPRVYYAMARDKIFFSSISQVNGKYRAPSKAIILQATIAAMMIFTGSFDQILTYMGFSLGLFPLFAVFGVFILRSKNKSVIKLPGYPVSTIIYLFAGLAILCLSFMERPLESGLALLTVITGIPLFFIFRKRYK